MEEKWHTGKLNIWPTRDARMPKLGLANGVKDGKIRGQGKPPPVFPFDDSGCWGVAGGVEQEAGSGESIRAVTRIDNKTGSSSRIPTFT